MYVIKKEFHFSASHELKGLKEDHPCMRVHGHNYKVIMSLQARKLNKDGFVIDYRELDGIKNFIDSTFDHRHLNDVVLFQPSAENLAKFLYNFVSANFISNYSGVLLQSVAVKETDKTIATYTPDKLWT